MSVLAPLNLPQCNLQLTRSQDKIYVWCVIRKKKLLLTREEWVRQHLVHFLENQCEVPFALMHSEKSIEYNKLSHRCDLLIYDRNGLPKIICECKEPRVKISEETLYQAARYNKDFQVPYLLLTNGINTILTKISENKIEIIETLEEEIRLLFKQ